MDKIQKALMNIKQIIKNKSEWQEAASWAKMHHPDWVKLATQRRRPEIRETYRKKIVRAYCDRCWY